MIKKSRRKACEDVFEALMSQAKNLGIETDGFCKEIIDELDVQFTGMAKYVNTKKLDSILNAVTQSIENRQDLTEEDLQTIKNTSNADGNITKRTMNCYPPFFKKSTASVELDFVNNKSILTDLNGKRERPLRDGFYFFKDYSRGDI